MKTIYILSFFFFLQVLQAQETLTLQPGATAGKDAEVFSLQPNTPFVTDLFRGNAWTFTGDPGVERGLLDFDLSSIPSGSIIDSAFLYLYSPDSPHSQTHSGENEAELRRITTPWIEVSVTWNNQPSTTGSNQVFVDAADANYQDYKIDVTELVTDMRLDPGQSFGFMLRLDEEDPFRRLAFVSSDYINSAKHPKLVVHYTPPVCNSLVLQPGASGKDAEVFSLQPNTNLNNNTFRANAWTFGGNPGIERGFIEFDLSSLPDDAEISFAYLSLYALDFPTTEFQSGENAAFLQRVTSDWGETTVTWNNQPATTTVNQVSLEESGYDYQDYINIDVTNLVVDMINDPSNSFGFMLRQQVEQYPRRMSFASGDDANQENHPRLEICYTTSVSTENETGQNIINVFPNPFTESIYVQLLSSKENLRAQTFDVIGRLVSESRVDADGEINLSSLVPSLYIVKIVDDRNQILAVTKVMKQQ